MHLYLAKVTVKVAFDTWPSTILGEIGKIIPFEWLISEKGYLRDKNGLNIFF